MKTQKWRHGRSRLPRILLGLLFSLVIGTVFRTAAQNEDDVWETPFNFSQSGAAVDPTFVAAPDGTFHIFWKDSFAGFVYVTGDGDTWSNPLAVRLPFSEPIFTTPSAEDFQFYDPILAADNAGRLHGFWTNEEGILLYSQVARSDVALPGSWTAPVRLATLARAQGAVVDENGRIHLVYIQTLGTPELPVGIYYRRSDDGGGVWTEPVRLYQSDYLRTMTAAQMNLQLVTSPERVHLAWDNPLQDIVFTMHSNDGGTTWSDPVVVDKRQPEDAPDAPGPAKINILLRGNEVHLTWSAGHEEASCNQYHQWSDDGGETWQSPQAVLEGMLDCPSEGYFAAGDDLLFLLVKAGSEAYLQAWDELQWSEPERQEPVSTFNDPVTNREVEFGCLQTYVKPDNRLLIVGCGGGETIQDVWGLERPLGGLENWSARFAPTPVWSQPTVIASSPFRPNPPELVVSSDGGLHAFWTLSEQAVNSGPLEMPEMNDDNAIYYSRLEVGRWSAPRPVLDPSDRGISRPAAVANDRGSLFLVWSDNETGDVYFSRAVADRAASTTEWLQPEVLSSPRSPAGNPDVIIDQDGTIYVAYAVPLNEERGIYLTYSTDGGETWTESERIFDGVTAGWQRVGDPHLALTDGAVHLVWTRHPSPPESGSLALVYARSQDGGQSWTGPEIMVEGNVIWSEIVGVGERTLHQAWLSLSEDDVDLWHQRSVDNGLTWSAPARISDPTTQGVATTLFLDAAGEPHLLQLAESDDGQLTLQEWLWLDEHWQLGEDLALHEGATEASAITALAAPDSSIAVVYASLLLDEISGQWGSYFFYTSRSWEAPQVTATSLSPLTPTPVPAATSTPSPTPLPTATLTLSDLLEENGELQSTSLVTSDPTGGLLLGLLPAILLVVGVFGAVLYFLRNR